MTRAVHSIHVRPAPLSDPPFDDSHESAPTTRPALPAARHGEQETLALPFLLPSGVPAAPQPPEATRSPGEAERAARATRSRPLPPPRPWAGRFAQAVIEVLSGLRPIAQLVRWTSAHVYEEIRRNTGASGDWARSPRTAERLAVRSVRLSLPRDDVTEVSAVVEVGGRARALALRLEAEGERWLCTELELG